MELLMSRHAIEQARERGISINEVKEVISKGAKQVYGGKIISSFRHIKVVFKKIRDKYFIITVMIKR